MPNPITIGIQNILIGSFGRLPSPVDYKEIKHDTDFQLKLQTADYTLWQRYSIKANFAADGSPFYYSVRAQHTKWE